MRTPLLAKGKRTRVSRSKTYPAPIGGMNTRDSPLSLPDIDSPSLTNWFPRSSYLETRGGSSDYATGTTGAVKTLATHRAMSGTETMFAATSSGVYNVNSSGAVGASVIARTDGKHQWINFGDGTNNWLCMFNGVDKPAFYNGTTWTAVDGASTPAITGVTTTGLIGAMAYQGRMFLIEANKLKFWYLSAGAVGGAATSFDLSAQTDKGGYLMAAMAYTYDGGSGVDDLAVFVTSQGDAIVYAGTDPATAANWVKKGTYFVGKPIGRRCLCKLGGDLLILTESGIVRLSSAMSGATRDDQFYITDKIRNTFNLYFQQYGSNFGWEMTVYHRQQALIVNVPLVVDGIHFQFVMNISTGSWTIFNAWDCETFGQLNGQLYFGYLTKTALAWSGTTDVGSIAIVTLGATANYNLGSSTKKMPKMGFFNLYASTGASMTIRHYIDNMAVNATDVTIAIPTGYSNVPFTAPAYPAVNIGVANLTSVSVGLQWYATTFIFEDGGFL